MKKQIVAFLVGLLLVAQAHAASGVISGAIRWDAWYENTYGDTCATAQVTLNPAAWQARAPWFAQASGSYGLNIVGTQANMDAEIGYAHTAGLKFWAFNEYTSGSPSICIKQAWTYYQASSLKSEINWTWISDLGNLGVTGNYSTQVAGYVANFADPQWQLVETNRPLWFIIWDAGNFAGHWGSSYINVAAMITALRSAATTAGLGNPYIVLTVTSGSQATAVQAMVGIGADAINFYSYGRSGTYSQLVSSDESLWTVFADTGEAFIPTAVVGWNTSPFHQQPQSWYNSGSSPFVGMNNVTTDGTPAAVASHIQDGVTWVQGHATADPSAVLLIYAWDECAEGGANMLIPTVGNPPPSTLLSALSVFLP